jgi:hypothetical protein
MKNIIKGLVQAHIHVLANRHERRRPFFVVGPTRVAFVDRKKEIYNHFVHKTNRATVEK